MRRREFIEGIAGAAAWPVVGRAQQGERVRRIGVLLGGDENDPGQKRRITAFTQALADLGWIDGPNVRMDLRWIGGDINRSRALAQELVGLQPDIILTTGLPATVAVRRETQTIPIVFSNVGDPVAGGIVARLDRPSENITGFAIFESSLGGKWLQLLSEIAPGLKRATVMFNPDTGPDISRFMRSLETAAQSLKIAPIFAPIYSDGESKRPSSPWGVSRAAALSSCRNRSRPCIACRSYRPRPKTTYRRSMRYLRLRETAACSPTTSTG